MAKRFVLDLNKCTGCQACQLACVIQNDLKPSQSWRRISTFNPLHNSNLPTYHFSLACNHCEEAPCKLYCPAMAFRTNRDTGAVILDTNNCMGCRYCSWVCPYDAPKYNQYLGVVEKCTFCIERLEENKEPACVTICPTNALTIEDYETQEFIYPTPGFTEVGIKPRIELIPLKRNRMKPIQASAAISSEAKKLLTDSVPLSSKIDPFKEWPLIVFTLLAAFLTGLICNCLVRCEIQNLLYIFLAGITGLAISTLHLGNIRQSYRAIFNWKNSWLSREILFFSAFLGLTFMQWITGMDNVILTIVIILAGFSTVISMDMVYLAAQTTRPTIPHSAQVTFTAVFILSMALGFQILATMVGLLKLFLYVSRRFRADCCDGPMMFIISALRVCIGFVIPFYLLFFVCDGNFCTIIWAGIIIGEIIDRFEFYKELEIITPAIQINLDMSSLNNK